MPPTDANRPHPECINLPRSGGDEVFGFSGTWWRRREKEGLIRLRRTKLPGHRTTRVCVPYLAAKALIDNHTDPRP